MNVRQVLLSALLLSIGLLALYAIGVYAQFDAQTFLETTAALPPVLLLLWLTLAIVEYLLQCERFMLITGKRMPLLEFAKVYNLGHLVAFISPVRSVGEAARVLVFSKALKLSKTESFSSVVSERALDVFVLALASVGIISLYSSALVPFLLIIATLLLLLILSNASIQSFLLSIIPVRQLRAFAENYFTHSRALFSDAKNVGRLLVLTIVLWCVDFVRYWLILAAFGVFVPLEISASITSLSYFSTIFSVFPGGLVFFEGFGIGAYVLLGYDSAQVMSAVLVERLFSYWIWILSGFLVVVLRAKSI